MPRTLLTGAALAALLTLTACATDPVQGDVSEDAGDAPAETLDVQSEFGEVTVPAEPQAALGMYTTDVDILIHLGIPLAASQPIRGDGWTTFPAFFPQDELAGVTPFANFPDYNYEEILAAQPDFILNGLGYDKKVVKRLPEIAPTYSVDAFDGRSWLEHFEETAEALGRTEQYDAWMARYEARLAEVREAIGDRADEIVVAPLGYWEGTLNSSCYSGVECQAFSDLGLTVFEGATKDDGTGVTLSGEQYGQLQDVDYAFHIAVPGEKGEQEMATTLDKLDDNAVWNELDFVKGDGLVTYDMEMTYGSPSGQMAFLDVIEEAIAG